MPKFIVFNFVFVFLIFTASAEVRTLTNTRGQKN